MPWKLHYRYLRISWLERVLEALDYRRAEDFSIACCLGSGLRVYDQRRLQRTGVIYMPEDLQVVSPRRTRLLRVLPEFIPMLMARLDYMQNSGLKNLLAVERKGTAEKMPREGDINGRLREILPDVPMEAPQAVMRNTAIIRMIQDGWRDVDIIAQLGMPYKKIEWCWEERTQNGFWENTPLPERRERAEALRRLGMSTRLPYFTDVELCQVYRTLVKLEGHEGWEKPCFFVRLLFGSGLRISEAVNLKASDVLLEFEPPVLCVRRAKGGKSRNTQVTPEFAPHLRRYLARMPTTLNGFLFPAVNWAQRRRLEPIAPVSPRCAWAWWHRVMDEAGIKGTHPHMARHTFASWEALRLPLFVLKDTLGHSSLVTTEKFYRHGIIGRNYSTGEPEWCELAKISPGLNIDAKKEPPKRFIRRSLMYKFSLKGGENGTTNVSTNNQALRELHLFHEGGDGHMPPHSSEAGR